jgi:two-component sensor histidine kinase
MVEEQTIELEKEKKELIDSYQIINKQNAEKDILIQEINHRVKNNLQFILAMVEMQMDKNETTGPLISTARRITAMSLVHEMLYDNKEVQVLHLKKYVSELIKNFTDLASNMENPVDIQLDIADTIVSAKTAISLGIIISELVSNSFKHAFNNIEFPIITIQIVEMKNTNQMVLTIGDNGNGMNVDCLSSNGFGMKMIDIFSRQLDGEYSIDCNNHFIYTLTFNN